MTDDIDVSVRPAPDPTRIADVGEFARELTLVRHHAGLSVRQVEKATGIVASTLGGYFAGRHSPPPAGLDAILAACGVDDPESVRQWHEALARARKVPGRRRPRTSEPPYRGLESFRAEDAPWFFGRSALVDALLAALEDRRGPLLVVGASGAGKSSLLRAGLVPALGERRAVVLTPGDRPLTTLVAHLAAARGADPDALRVALDTDAAARAATPDDPLLVVDQLEEVFAPGVDEVERSAFIRVLCALGTPVVAAIRADFYARALEHVPLAHAAQSGQVVVGPMDDDALRAAIVEPARRADLRIEDGLVEILLSDLHRAPGVGDDPRSAGLLPLLSHALLATWRRGQGVRMTLADYRAVGGVAGGVAQSAEEAFAELPDDRQAVVRRLFLRLVHVAPDMADTRRRAERAELLAGDDGTVAEVLDLFVARRLLTADEHAVVITHETLLTAWPRLRGWIDADRAGLAAHRRLAEAARAWRDAGRDPDLLLRGGRLAAAQEMAAQEMAAQETGPRRRRPRRRRPRRWRSPSPAGSSAPSSPPPSHGRRPNATSSAAGPGGSAGCWPCSPSRCWSPRARPATP